MATQRQSNMELCRLASIILVMLIHTTVASLGYDVSLGVRLLEGFSIIGVNVFILLTGYFSTTPKKTNLINLAFICLFWMIVKVACRYCFDEPITTSYLFFITSSNWFIASYIVLIFLTPILNLFCDTVSKKLLWSVVIALLLLEMWFDWLSPKPEVGIGAQNGYSVLSFAILYLLARAIKLYGLPQWFKKHSALIYIGCSVVVGLWLHVGALKGHDLTALCISYINPVVIVSSVAFLMMFEKMHFQSEIVNHIAKSTLAVLLGHTAIFFLYTKQFKFIYENFAGWKVVGYWCLAIVVVFCASIALDQLRILIYNPIERLLKRKIKNNNIFELPVGKN